MEYLLFDEIIRDLIVNLKGRLTLLTAANKKEETTKQIEDIVSQLKNSLSKLDEASYQNKSAAENIEKLQKELSEALNVKVKLETKLDEQNNLNETLKKRFEEAEDSLNAEKQVNSKLLEEINFTKSELDNDKAELVKAQADNSEISELNKKISLFEENNANLESEIESLKSELISKNDEISELSKSLNIANDINNHEEYVSLKIKTSALEKVENENADLKIQVAELKKEIQNNKELEGTKIKEAYEATVKADLLSQELTNTQQIVRILHEKIQNQTSIEEENASLKKRLKDLQDALNTVMQAQSDIEVKFKGKFALSAEDCIKVFDTLSSASSRLEHSLENKDLFAKVCESLKVFEHSNAIRQIPTVGVPYNPLVHRVTRTYLSDDLPDNMIIFQETVGFSCADKIVQKARVWIAKSKFVCSDCGNVCRPHEFFCPKCGLELTSPDGSGKRNLLPLPISQELVLPIVDALIKQTLFDKAKELLRKLTETTSLNPEITRRQDLLAMTEG